VKHGDLQVRYDENCFPEFPTQYETLLPNDALKRNYGDHFKWCNEKLLKEIENNPKLQEHLGLLVEDIAMIKAKPTKSHPGYVWHHHQDIGRMQLVSEKYHDTDIFPHTGGHSIWGK
jgi:hypothetical protein